METISKIIQDSVSGGFWNFIGYWIIISIPFEFLKYTIKIQIRHWSIRKHGYPPPHCNAEWNVKKIKDKIMSYNIDTWKTKKLKDLKIPIIAFYKSREVDWHPEQPTIIDSEKMEVELECGGEQSIKGILKDGNLSITEIEMQGEGSGTFKHLILNEALKESTGELEAVLVWEGGDSITRLKVKDGEISEFEVEL